MNCSSGKVHIDRTCSGLIDSLPKSTKSFFYSKIRLNMELFFVHFGRGLSPFLFVCFKLSVSGLLKT